jgi:hypothetical protein
MVRVLTDKAEADASESPGVEFGVPISPLA